MTGNNTPVFFIRDPVKFPDFIHTQKKNPRTNMQLRHDWTKEESCLENVGKKSTT